MKFILDGKEIKKSDFPELNYDAFKPVNDFRKKSGLSKIIFMGGALLKNDLRKDRSVDDYDLMLVGEEERQNFNNIKKHLKNTKYKVVGGHGETKSNLAMTQYKKGDKIFELCLKKDYCKTRPFGTFEIDNFYATINKDGNVEINDNETIKALRTKVTQFKEDTKDYYRVVSRMLVHVSKYGFKDFIFKDGQHFVIEDNMTEERHKKNIDALKVFVDRKERSKAEFLAKFLLMVSRCDNIKNFVETTNKSKIVERVFPEVSRVLNDKNFLKFLEIESKRPYNKRQINSNLDIFNKLYQYCHNENKTKFIQECKILEKARSTKKSKILEKLKSLENNSNNLLIK